MKPQNIFNSFRIKFFIVFLFFVFVIQFSQLNCLTLTEITFDNKDFYVGNFSIKGNMVSDFFGFFDNLSTDTTKNGFCFIKPLGKLGISNVDSFEVKSCKSRNNEDERIAKNKKKITFNEIYHKYPRLIIWLAILIFGNIIFFSILSILVEYRITTSMPRLDRGLVGMRRVINI